MCQSVGAIRILVYFQLEKSHLVATFFFTNALKQLYQQEVPEGPSKIYTDKKNFREDLEFPEGGLRYRNCLNYITLHYITIAPRLYV